LQRIPAEFDKLGCDRGWLATRAASRHKAIRNLREKAEMPIDKYGGLTTEEWRSAHLRTAELLEQGLDVLADAAAAGTGTSSQSSR
jgi:hypothetical protein